jgi:N-acetylneuraminic acid mutarotase
MIIQPARASADSWVAKAPMPSANAGGGAVSLNGKIYVVGSNFTYAYNPSTDTWVSRTPLLTHRQSFALAIYQNKIYVSGGCSGFNQVTGYPINCTGANDEYDPATDTWESKAPMPTARAELQANEVNGKIYLIGGTLPDGSVSNVNEAYNPLNDSWSLAAPIPTSVGLYASAVIGNKIYVEGGGQSGPSIGNLNQIFDPEANRWTLGAPLPVPVLWAAAAATTGSLAPTMLYVIGGTTDGIHALNTTYIYSPQANSWILGASMPTARGILSLAVLNDALYALGGTENLVDPHAPAISLNEQYLPLSYREPAPSPSIPEFPKWITLPLFLPIIFLMLIAKRNRLLSGKTE